MQIWKDIEEKTNALQAFMTKSEVDTLDTPLTPEELSEVLEETQGGYYDNCKKRIKQELRSDNTNMMLIYNIEKYLTTN